jgi:hypothetical protein
LAAHQLSNDGEFVHRGRDVQTVSDFADTLVEGQGLAKGFATIEFQDGKGVGRTVRLRWIGPEFDLVSFNSLSSVTSSGLSGSGGTSFFILLPLGRETFMVEWSRWLKTLVFVNKMHYAKS